MAIASPIPRSRQHVVRGLLHPAFGPLVRVRIEGPEGGHDGAAVLDTGASMSAIDQQIARELGLPSHGAATWRAVTSTSGDPALSPLRRAGLTIAGGRQLWELDLIEVPSLSHAVAGYHVIALLGWDFLGQCRLTVDGPAGMFALEVPILRGASRRR